MSAQVRHEPTGTGAGASILSISGMTCEGCVNTVKRVLSRVPGVRSVEVDLGSGCAVIAGEARPEELLDAVEGSGYGVQLAASGTGNGEKDEHGRSCCC